MNQETIELIETDISFLPAEMILKIFGFLTFRDRLAASRTCKAWNQIAFDARKMRIRISDSNCLDMTRNMQVYEKYRNASVYLGTQQNTNVPFDVIRNAMAYIVKTAPIESLVIAGSRRSVKTFLNENLLSMNWLTSLVIMNCYGTNQRVIPISHPNMRSISLGDQDSRGLIFEINCPSLAELTIGRNVEIADHVVAQLQRQLQSLELFCDGNKSAKIYANADLSNLKKFCVTFETTRVNQGVNLSFSRMRNLVELEICNKSRIVIPVAAQFGVLTNLSKLTLTRMVIDAEGFATSARNMMELRDLQLIHCTFILSVESDYIALENVKNLYIIDCDLSALPHFTKLKRLSFSNVASETDDTFVLICNSYPDLEKLRFKVDNPEKLKFRSSTTLSHIGNLKQLKNLHLIGLNLDGIDWTECNAVRGLNLVLDSCRFGGIAALQLAESFGRGLLRLSMDYCYLSAPRADVFEVHKNCIWGLRNYLPWCRVTYRDCCVMYDNYGLSPSFYSEEFIRYLRTMRDVPSLEVFL